MPDIHNNHELVDRLLTLHPPASDEVGDRMDMVRAEFIDLGHLIVDSVPSGPDQTLAVRKLHEACMAAIAGIACNQD
jgi:hypothetical protein